jgi:hypothetical protein
MKVCPPLQQLPMTLLEGIRFVLTPNGRKINQGAQGMNRKKLETYGSKIGGHYIGSCVCPFPQDYTQAAGLTKERINFALFSLTSRGPPRALPNK